MNTFALWEVSQQFQLWSANVLLQVTLVTAAALAGSFFLRRAPALRYGVLCSALVLPSGDFSKRLGSAATDPDGNFTCQLIAGCNCSLQAEGRAVDLDATVAEKLNVSPGQPIDLGDLELDDERKFVPVDAPDKKDAARAVPAVKTAVAQASTEETKAPVEEGKMLGLHMVVTPGPSKYDFQAVQRGELAADEDFVANISRENYQPAPTTDREGRLQFGALIPNATYRFIKFTSGGPDISNECVAKSGELFDMGKIRVNLR